MRSPWAPGGQVWVSRRRPSMEVIYDSDLDGIGAEDPLAVRRALGMRPLDQMTTTSISWATHAPLIPSSRPINDSYRRAFYNRQSNKAI